MMLGEDVKKEKRCYGCGQLGHMRGTDECRASKEAIWGGAPKAYLEKVQRKYGKKPTGEKRTFTSESKTPCPYWSTGDGYCTYTERCKFDHSGPQGGSKRFRENGSKGKGKGKGKGKSRGKGKGKGRGGGNRSSKGSSTMIVKKKEACFEDEKHPKASSMMIKEGERDDRED